MENNNLINKIKNNNIYGLGIAFVIFVVFVGLLIFTLNNIFRKNEFGEEIKIDNFSKYYPNVSGHARDQLFANLYNIVVSNSKDIEIPKLGALIRKDSVSNRYDDNLGIYYYDFIVDIESIGQSYVGHFTSSSDSKAGTDAVGYDYIFTCPKKDQLVFDDFGCKDMFSNSLSSTFPITKVLPLMIEYYSDNFAYYTKYYINYELTNEKKDIVIRITDYTGGNREKAFDKMKELGFDLNDYNVEYVDKSDNK